MALYGIFGYSFFEDDSAAYIVINPEEHLYEGAAAKFVSSRQVTVEAGECTKIYAKPDAEELWYLDLYPLAGAIHARFASIKILKGMILVRLPKGLPGSKWGRLLGDCCESWRNVAATAPTGHEAGYLACSGAVLAEGPSGYALRQAALALVDACRREPLGIVTDAPSLNSFSIFESVGTSERARVLTRALEDVRGDRCVGAMLGMAIADSLGAQFEFIPAGARGHCVDFETLAIVGATNRFRLEAGQWTDDTAMALCMADSLLCRGAYDGSDIRVRFWNWWHRGYNNAFRLDARRSQSVGLGGNISDSLYAIVDAEPAPRYVVEGSEDAGNGSLMRLAPMPLFFYRNIELAVEVSAESSLTTHAGQIAADACGLLGFIIAKAMARPTSCTASAAAFLDGCREAYLERLEAEAQPTLKRLLLAQEPFGSRERCWNWRDAKGPYLAETLAARGRKYNGYPVDAGYFGSYCIDGLALALHCAYHTTSASEAIARCVNLLGDADSTGAICGQIVGAFYGAKALDPRLVAAVERWDGGEIALRGALLFAMGPCAADESSSLAALVASATPCRIKRAREQDDGIACGQKQPVGNSLVAPRTAP